MTGNIAIRADIDQLREHFDQARAANREYLEAARKADREYLEQVRQADREHLERRLAKTEAKVRGWMITQAFAIIGANVALIGVAAALSELLH